LTEACNQPLLRFMARGPRSERERLAAAHGVSRHSARPWLSCDLRVRPATRRCIRRQAAVGVFCFARPRVKRRRLRLLSDFGCSLALPVCFVLFISRRFGITAALSAVDCFKCLPRTIIPSAVAHSVRKLSRNIPLHGSTEGDRACAIGRGDVRVGPPAEAPSIGLRDVASADDHRAHAGQLDPTSAEHAQCNRGAYRGRSPDGPRPEGPR